MSQGGRRTSSPDHPSTERDVARSDHDGSLVPGPDFGRPLIPGLREAYERWARREGRRPSLD